MWKLGFVLGLVAYHGWCIVTYNTFKNDANTRGHKFYRVMNELPVLLLLGILIMVVVKTVLICHWSKMFHIVLVEPEIPPNTGNLIRLAAKYRLSIALG